MRRAIARGRIFPQSYSTDRRYARLSLKACALFPLMWANADDQGRLCGDPEEIKYAVCPNIDHITKADIPDILLDLQMNSLISIYSTPKSAAIQILDWWEVQKLQWAWPSDYPPPDGWHDRLRYKTSATEVYKENWDTEFKERESSKERDIKEEKEKEELRRRGRGNSGEHDTTSHLSPHLSNNNRSGEALSLVGSPESSPESSGEKMNASPSPTGSNILLLDELTKCFKERWGTVKASAPEKIIPRALGPKEEAQLRDLSLELAAVNCPVTYIKPAFDEAAGLQKYSISYARAVLLDWIGVRR